MKQKRSQAWGIDLIIAVTIFSIGILFFFIYSVNQPSENKEIFDILNYEGGLVFESILSEGYPKDWENNTVIVIGIVENGKVNQTKYNNFKDLAETDYNRTKQLFNTIYDYYFFIEGESGIGKPGIDVNNISSKNLIKITRFTIYQNKPKTTFLYIWEE